MANIIFDSGKLKIMEFLDRLREYAGFEKEYTDELWQAFLSHKEIYDEFVYYVEHHELLGKYTIREYNIADCYVWQRNNYIFRHLDRGKIERNCNEETIVLWAFEFFMKMQDDPETYISKLEKELGQDRMR